MGSGNWLFTSLVAGLILVLAGIFVMIGVVIVKSVKNAKMEPHDNAENDKHNKRP
ncbi:hypothetical protein [Bacillus sp. FJAT-42376]|uniref:hypothetical protein n=1 Tax=Bacillus sp. FJAT-42376 TaxID=2014076 RepID=UPI0013DDD097|nr:hypothetical protein [Bacillus sp. FJAT-42376]